MQLAHKFTEKHGSASSPAREGCILFFFSSSFTLEQTRFCADSQLIRGPFHCSSAYHIDFFTLALVQVARNARWGFIFPSYWRACPVRKKKAENLITHVDHTWITRGSHGYHSWITRRSLVPCIFRRDTQNTVRSLRNIQIKHSPHLQQSAIVSNNSHIRRRHGVTSRSYKHEFRNSFTSTTYTK